MHMAQQVHTGRGWRLLRYLLELVAAVLVGMLVLGAAVRGLLALVGGQFPAGHSSGLHHSFSWVAHGRGRGRPPQ
jgi:hypothetical protein